MGPRACYGEPRAVEVDPGLLRTAAVDRLALWRAAVAVAPVTGAEELIIGIRVALADDLDAPAALAVVDAWAKASVAAGGSESRAGKPIKAALNSLLGVAL